MKIKILCGICLLSVSLLSAAELSSSNNPKLAKVKKAFPKADVNSDGILTISELRGFVDKKMKGSATSKTNPYLKRLLKEEKDADKNSDGILTKAELLAHLK